MLWYLLKKMFYLFFNLFLRFLWISCSSSTFLPLLQLLPLVPLDKLFVLDLTFLPSFSTSSSALTSTSLSYSTPGTWFICSFVLIWGFFIGIFHDSLSVCSFDRPPSYTSLLPFPLDTPSHYFEARSLQKKMPSSLDHPLLIILHDWRYWWYLWYIPKDE